MYPKHLSTQTPFLDEFYIIPWNPCGATHFNTIHFLTLTLFQIFTIPNSTAPTNIDFKIDSNSTSTHHKNTPYRCTTCLFLIHTQVARPGYFSNIMLIERLIFLFFVPINLNIYTKNSSITLHSSIFFNQQNITSLKNYT